MDKCWAESQGTPNIGVTVPRICEQALTMKDPEVIILMTDLAADYEKLAERAAAKMAGKSPPRTDRQSTDDASAP